MIAAARTVGLLLAVLLLVAGLRFLRRREPFLEPSSDVPMLQPSRVVYLQGTSLPTKPIEPQQRSDPCDAPSVDGTSSAPRSMFAFAYNACRPECCNTSPYSCQGGCACITKAQRELIARRGIYKAADR
jgi:hypothetical protein